MKIENATTILTIILVVLKLTNVIDWHWVFIFAPILLTVLSWFLIGLFLIVATYFQRKIKW